MFKISRLAASVAAACSSMVISSGAHAQSANTQTLEAVTITGSNIKRVDAETASPITVIKREDIERSGKQTIAEVIRSLPVDNNGSISNNFSGGFASGAAGVSLRGLAVNSTLVLVNGRRLAPYGLGDDGQRNFVDLSSIPLDAVERVEVLKDGASAIYGSDAIAGVVNIILRSDFKGVAVNVSTGASGDGDGNTTRAAITAGVGSLTEDKYNLFVNFEASKQKAIRQSDRKNREWIGSGDLRRYGYDIYSSQLGGWFEQQPDGVPPLVSPNPFGAVRDPVTLQYTQLPGCNSTIPGEVGFGGCLYDLTDNTQITPKQEKLNLFLRGTLQGTSAFAPFAELGLFNSKVASSIGPASVSSTWPDALNNRVVSNANIQLPANHPDNPLGVSGLLRYLTADVGPRTTDTDTKVLRAVLGAKGTVEGWDYETGLLRAQTETERTQKGRLRNSVLQEVLAGTGPLGFYRLGVNAGLNSAALYAALSPTLVDTSKASVTSVDLKASRELMALAGGPLGIGVGVEARRETIDSPGTPFTAQADIVGLGYAQSAASRNVVAAFAEVAAPVIKDLELSAAARVDRYSDYGNSFTPKLGAKWNALPQLALRGTYAEGFRAPGAAENGNSSNAGFAPLVDPVRCGLTGLPADCSARNVVQITTGNPDIKPETSKSITFGLVFEPVAGTNASIDFWDIRRKDEISGVDASLLLANPGAFPGSSITRDTNDLPGTTGTGTLLAVSSPFFNTTQTRTNGVDIDLRQVINAGSMGRFTAGLNLTYVNSFRRTLPDGTTLEYAGTHGPTVLSGNAGAPRTRALLALGWERGPASLSTQVNYISSFNNTEYLGDPAGCLNHFSDGTDAPNGCRIPSFTTVDLYGKYRIDKGFEIYGSVQNLFDRIAPLDPQTYGAINFNPTYHSSGAIGRFFTVGLKYSWL